MSLQRVLHSQKFRRYIITGIITVGVDVGGLVLLKEVVGMNVYLAATLSFWSSLLVNFFINKLWTFEVMDNTPHHIGFYFGLICLNYLTGITLIAVLGALHINYATAKLAATALTTCWNFLAYKYLVFVPKRQSPAATPTSNPATHSL